MFDVQVNKDFNFFFFFFRGSSLNYSFFRKKLCCRFASQNPNFTSNSTKSLDDIVWNFNQKDCNHKNVFCGLFKRRRTLFLSCIYIVLKIKLTSTSKFLYSSSALCLRIRYEFSVDTVRNIEYIDNIFSSVLCSLGEKVCTLPTIQRQTF